MVYLGRIVGVGILPNERPFAVYGVSGRSEPSRARVARLVEDGKYLRVNIGAIDQGNLTPEQIAQKQWIYYDGMIAYIGGPAGTKDVLVSNGIQTEKIHMLRDLPMLSMLSEMEITELAMRFLGPEGDGHKTPRIAGRINEFGENELSIITENGFFGEMGYGHNIEPGKMKYVSTYRGAPGSNDILVPNGEVEIPMGVMDLEGEDAQALADGLYDSIDPSIVVCTAAALWNPDGEEFKIAIRNLHKAKQ